jgi:hypothetical protein
MNHLMDTTERFSQTLRQLTSLCESEIEKLFLLQIIQHVINRPHHFAFGFIVEIVPPDILDDGTVVFPKEANYSLPDAPGILTGVRIINFFQSTLIEITPQKQFEIDLENSPYKKTYRLDFELIKYSLSHPKHPLKKYCVECDGLEYHRSAEQIKRDNERARHLSGQGKYDTLRYLGTEIYNQTDSEIGGFLHGL